VGFLSSASRHFLLYSFSISPTSKKQAISTHT